MKKDDLKLAIQKALKDEDMQNSIHKMHDLFIGNYFSIKNFFAYLNFRVMYLVQSAKTPV